MSEEYFSPFSKEELLPKEEKLETIVKKNNLSLGIPKEINLQEKRISLTPDAVSVLIANGHKIVIESGEAFFSGTTWRGKRCMRISVCNWKTNDSDIERAVNAVQLALTK